MDISGNNNNRTGTLIVVQRKNYLTPIKAPRFGAGTDSLSPIVESRILSAAIV